MLTEGRGNPIREVVGYLGVGGAGASLYVLLSTLLHGASLNAWTASVTGYLICIPIVYLAQRNIAFQSHAPIFGSFLKYAATQAISLSLAAVLPYVLVTYGGMPAIVSFLVVSIAGACVSFGLLKFWTFADHSSGFDVTSCEPR